MHALGNSPACPPRYQEKCSFLGASAGRVRFLLWENGPGQPADGAFPFRIAPLHPPKIEMIKLNLI